MRKIKRTPNHVFLPLGIYVSCNLCPCCNLSPCPSHNDCRYESACQLKYHVKEINGDIFSPNCKLINIRYTKGNKPGRCIFTPEKIELVEEL